MEALSVRPKEDFHIEYLMETGTSEKLIQLSTSPYKLRMILTNEGGGMDGGDAFLLTIYWVRGVVVDPVK